MKRVPLGITVGLMAVTALVTFVCTHQYTLDRVNAKLSNINEKQQLYTRLSEVDAYARSAYIGSPDENIVSSSLVKGYVAGLGDPYARYFTADEYAAYSAVSDGMVEGLGFSCEKDKNGYIRVTQVEAGGAAEDAGILVNDIITAVNNKDVIAYDGGYDEAILLLDCTQGTRVSLYVKRTDEYGTNFIDYDVVARLTEHITVTTTMVDDIGFIRIKEITAKTDKQISEAIVSAVQQGAVKLIFDVRDLAFTDLDVLRACLDHIIGAEDVVTATEKTGESRVVVACTEAEQIKMPMAVIINENTEGCAELFASALRDFSGAVLVGHTTKGHGTYQKPYICSDNSVLLISTALLSTPGSGSFAGTGIAPDEEADFPDDLILGTMPDMDAQFYDTQFIRAMEILNEKG